MSMALHTRVPRQAGAGEMPPETPSFEAGVIPSWILPKSSIMPATSAIRSPASSGRAQSYGWGSSPRMGAAFARLWNLPLMQGLIDERLLVDLSPVPQHMPGFDAVYRLADTPRITYWHEWSSKMQRAAALRLIALLQRLAQHKLTLRNPHPWNLLYDGRSFVYINPGSIVPLDAEIFGRSYEKVARFFVRPLLLIENGFAHTARRLTEDPREGVLAEDVQHLSKPWATWKQESGAHQILPFPPTGRAILRASGHRGRVLDLQYGRRTLDRLLRHRLRFRARHLLDPQAAGA